MGNSDDDEDSDSDIERMFQQAHALKEKQRRSLAPANDDDDDSLDPNLLPSSSSRRRKKSKTDRMSVQIALRTEKQHQKDALNAKKLQEIDLLDEEEEDTNAELEASRIAATTILIDDDSSDTERARLPPVTRPIAPRHHPSLMTRRLSHNEQILERALDMTRAPLSKSGPSLLRLRVVCTIRSAPQVDGTPPDSVTTCTVDIIETSTVQALMDRILTHYLKRNPQTNVIGLQYEQHTLHSRQTLDMYNLPEQNATIQATIHSSDHVLAAAAKAPPARPTIEGPSITVILRRADTSKSSEVRMLVGTRQALQVLVDQYAPTQNLRAAQVSLHFDGDRLNLQKTPAFYEMDEDDLIDVKVVAAAATSIARPKGPTMVLILRHATGKEARLRIGKQQALQVLVEQYAAQSSGLHPQKISLYFDGDRLNLQKTPAFYEMDEEDLIDVKVAL